MMDEQEQQVQADFDALLAWIEEAQKLLPLPEGAKSAVNLLIETQQGEHEGQNG